VAGTADGQKFRQSLNDAEKNCLKDIDFSTPFKMSNSPSPPLLKGDEGGLLIDNEPWHSLEFIYKLQFS
jgi:hypothetical protein